MKAEYILWTVLAAWLWFVGSALAMEEYMLMAPGAVAEVDSDPAMVSRHVSTQRSTPPPMMPQVRYNQVRLSLPAPEQARLRVMDAGAGPDGSLGFSEPAAFFDPDMGIPGVFTPEMLAVDQHNQSVLSASVEHARPAEVVSFVPPPERTSPPPRPDAPLRSSYTRVTLGEPVPPDPMELMDRPASEALRPPASLSTTNTRPPLAGF